MTPFLAAGHGCGSGHEKREPESCLSPQPLGSPWSRAAQITLREKQKDGKERNGGRTVEKNVFRRKWVQQDTCCSIRKRGPGRKMRQDDLAMIHNKSTDKTNAQRSG